MSKMHWQDTSAQPSASSFYTMATPTEVTTFRNVVEDGMRTVLVVDDEPTARMALAARLKRLGYRVIEAEDGKTGLEALRRERPDLTILDWVMPEMDGPTFCEVIRQDPDLLSSQILMMTSHDQPEQIAEGLARGADDFLSKAASKYEVMARVQAGMRSAALIKRLEHVTEEIRTKQETLERELQSAARYVETLLPASGTVVPGVQLVHTYRPSLTLGGDLFNIVQWSDDFLGICWMPRATVSHRHCDPPRSQPFCAETVCCTMSARMIRAPS
jgi:phosphoserine phosphatase RsbU/P